MTGLWIAPARAWRSAVTAAVVVGLALVVVAASAQPSQAADEVRLTQPGSGAGVDGPTQIRVEVDTRALEEVQWVEARLSRNGDVVGSAARLSHEGGERSGGTSTWTASWDPASGWVNGGGSLANGSYRLEARARSEVGLGGGDTTAWRGHSVTVSQPATAPELQAELDGGQAVALQWSEAAGSDFVRYELERAEDGGAFDTVARISRRGATAYRDEPPGPGTWHYRVTAVHDDGGGGETSATSGTATVETAGADDEDGDDDLSPSPDDTDDSDASDDSDDSGLTPSPGGGDGGDGDQRGDGDGDGGGSSDGQGTGGSSSGRSAEPSLREGREAPPPSGQSSVPQLDGGEAEAEEPVADESADDGFSTELPYDDPDPEGGDEREAEIAGAETPQNRGVITVGDQEFALERALPPMAGGLLLFVTAGHILRLRQQVN